MTLRHALCCWIFLFLPATSKLFSPAMTSLVLERARNGAAVRSIVNFHAKHARMLVHENIWGMLATTSVLFHGTAFANVASYSGRKVPPCDMEWSLTILDVGGVDGIGFAKENATGTVFFYLSDNDFTAFFQVYTQVNSRTCVAMDLHANPNATLALSQAQRGPNACFMDPEDPTCWRLSLTGKVMPVGNDQRTYAQSVVFSKHPQMKHWPKKHGFRFYVLQIEHILFLDFYGPAHQIPISEYYKVKFLITLVYAVFLLPRDGCEKVGIPLQHSIHVQCITTLAQVRLNARGALLVLSQTQQLSCVVF
ncbi:hypothetical protein PsorP6_017671 [Peronosclerospora sorghi]|uniref:Uncharacterized protein n=1 Tax=Peronosclerospora sorghi TaxID=230839 RepID=A0ACC0WPA6_9STRA|nr:hypothetical protein PsorP6_017671 [Peronosclerospora sorghi]